jgi:hypothetical protein
MAVLRTCHEHLSDLAAHAASTGMLLSVDGNVPPCPARGVSTGLTVQQTLAALESRTDAWAPLFTQLALLAPNGRGTGTGGSPVALTGAPAGCIAALFAGPLPINIQVAVPLFWIRTA